MFNDDGLASAMEAAANREAREKQSRQAQDITALVAAVLAIRDACSELAKAVAELDNRVEKLERRDDGRA